MRIAAILFLGSTALACSGSPADIGDAGNDGSSFTCQGHICEGYCVHPDQTVCPTCTALPDGGTCPGNATVSNGCPSGPAMPPGEYCVTYPTPPQPYCTDVLVNTCLGSGAPTPPERTDVYCLATACAL